VNISGIGIHARKGVKLTAHLDKTATAIAIRDRHTICAATIYLPVADYERAMRACAAFNAIMSEPDAKSAEDAPPDLLEALKALVREMPNYAYCEDVPDDAICADGRTTGEWRAALAAIKKAEG